MNTNSLDLESGSSQYASIADASQTGLDITGDISIECWVKPESWGAGNPVLVAKTNNNTDMGFFLASYDSGKLQFGFSSDGGTTDPSTTKVGTNNVVLATGTWTHVAVTADVSGAATGVIIYINGSPVADTDQVNNATSIHNSDAAFSIGCYYSTGTAGNFFDGLIDEVRVWNTVLTPAQISANYQKAIASSTNLQGSWQLNNDYLDGSGNNNTLTASGSPVFSTDVPFVGDEGNFLAFM